MAQYEQGPFKKSSFRDTFESLVVTVILAVFGTTFVVQAFKIPTGSMENTLLIGDHLLVNKFIFAYQPGWLRHILPYRDLRHNDVVVFKFPGTPSEAQEPGEHFVKRLMALPGDRLRVANRQVFLNGQALHEPYVRHYAPAVPFRGDDFPPLESVETRSGAELRWSEEIQKYMQGGNLVVPSGNYFAMGDNRENSWDSRFWGFVPRTLISGRPVLIYWSFETPEGEYERNSLGDRVSQMVDLVVHFVTKTRWRRTLQFVR